MIQLTIPNPKYTQNLSQTQNNKLLTQPRVSFNPKNLSNCTLKKPTICSSRRPLSSSHAMKNYQNHGFPLFIKQIKIRKREIEIDLVMRTVTTEKATTPLLGFT